VPPTPLQQASRLPPLRRLPSSSTEAAPARRNDAPPEAHPRALRSTAALHHEQRRGTLFQCSCCCWWGGGRVAATHLTCAWMRRPLRCRLCVWAAAPACASLCRCRRWLGLRVGRRGGSPPPSPACLHPRCRCQRAHHLREGNQPGAAGWGVDARCPGARSSPHLDEEEHALLPVKRIPVGAR
jgi:hypothetical protein